MENFRKTIMYSPIFIGSEKYAHRFNLICAVMDRIDSAIKVINSFGALPDSEESFIQFLVFTSILKDGIYKLYENIFHKKPPCIYEKKFFINVTHYYDKIFNETTYPTDDEFFEYFRSIAFAHPFETSKRNRIFLQNGETQCSPWVITNRYAGFLLDGKNLVGIRIYSNINEKSLKDIFFSFDDLKGYVKKRYDYLPELTKWAKSEVDFQANEWKKVKVEISEDPIKTLNNIVEILESRFEDSQSIKLLITQLEGKNTIEENFVNVEIFKTAIKNMIPTLCECVDNLDYERLEETIGNLYEAPPKTYGECGYHLEKIFSYLSEKSEVIKIGSDEEWGLIQADNFAKRFAKKWVVIKPYEMSYTEIKLLVCVACYLERQKQIKK